jgi:hypothetical protein
LIKYPFIIIYIKYMIYYIPFYHLLLYIIRSYAVEGFIFFCALMVPGKL